MCGQELFAALTHDHQPIGKCRDFLQHRALVGIRLRQNGVQGRDNRHAQFAQQSQDVAAGPAAENAVLMLQADEIDIVDIQKVGGTAIRFNVLLREFEANAIRDIRNPRRCH